MAGYGVAIFVGAFLLFQVQPLMGKYVLPWFGGAPAVWTTCLLFFQVLLLAGYGYAHLSTKWLKPRAQVLVHLGLAGLALLTLPIIPSANWKPGGTGDPTFRILGLLTVSVGLPYFVLSASAPLFQSWFAQVFRGRSPYRLYALSNAGSLLALVSFPVLFEPWLTRATQATFWAAGLGGYFAASLWAAGRVWSLRSEKGEPAEPSPPAIKPGVFAMLLWLALPFCASVLLMAITNKICQDVAVIAFLWVLPLALYLLSFIVCFDRPQWYRRRWFGSLLMVSLPLLALAISDRLPLSVPAQVGLYGAGLFLACMVCHGELYRLKPDPGHLTSFYLMIAAGGALGGVFVALVAPRIFSDYFELDWALLLTGALFLGLWGRAVKALRARPALVLWGLATVLWASSGVLLWRSAQANTSARVYRARNFYGVLSVYRRDAADPRNSLVEMIHGRIAHGMQFLDRSRSRQPTLYYSAESGVAKAFAALAGPHRHIGVVGLGAGTLATYGKAGDRFCFYEINPEVEAAARKHFTFLQDSAAETTVLIGDARLSLEHETPQGFDLLVLDAFSGDAIPIHLLTREALQLYRRHLKPGGILAAHISNMSLDLEPIVLRLARDGGWVPAVFRQPRPDYQNGVLPSVWVLLSQDPGFISRLPGGESASAATGRAKTAPLWTDDFSALFPILRWPGGKPGPAKTLVFEAQSAAKMARAANLAQTISDLRAELNRHPDSASAMNNLAVMLATAPDPALRNGEEAVRLAERASAAAGNNNPVILTTLAAAYAEAGRFPEAVQTAEQALELARESRLEVLVKRNGQLLEYYRRGEAYHQQDKTN